MTMKLNFFAILALIVVLIPHREGMTTEELRGVKAKTCVDKAVQPQKVGRCLSGRTRKPAWLRHS